MNNDEVYAPDGVPAGQIIRRPPAPDQASSVNAEQGHAQAVTLGGDLGGATDHAVVGERPTTVVQQTTVALRDRLRLALRRHIDPDDDTMPALWRGDGFIWLSVDSVLDDLVRAAGVEQLAAERDQAEAAIARVRAECEAIGTPHICNAVDLILGVLDQPQERP